MIEKLISLPLVNGKFDAVLQRVIRGKVLFTQKQAYITMIFGLSNGWKIGENKYNVTTYIDR